MDPRWDEHGTDEKVRAKRAEALALLRAWVLEQRSAPRTHLYWGGQDYIRTTLAAPIRSAMLTVGQYWSDQASDEVHVSMVASSERVPTWPHECREGPIDESHFTVCGWCGDFEDDLVPGYGHLIPPFEPFCHEGADQNQDHSQSQLERRFLGSLEPMVPRAGVRAPRGIPTEISVYADVEGVARVDWQDPLPWIFAPRVRFLPRSEQPIWPMMRTARAIGPLGVGALTEIADRAITFESEELEVDASEEGALVALECCDFPRLSLLRLVGEHARPRAPELPLARLELARAALEDDFMDDAKLPCPVTVAMHDTDARRAAGWAVTFRDEAITIGHVGWHPRATRELLGRIRALFPGATLEPGPFWSP